MAQKMAFSSIEIASPKEGGVFSDQVLELLA
jgi:hypothetical protein